MTSDVVLHAVPDPEDPGTFVPAPPSRHRASGKLKLWQQSELMRELAKGEKKRSDLAREYGVSHQYIARFADRYAREIAKLRTDLDNAFAHLWSFDKVHRLEVLQKVIMDRLAQPYRSPEDDRVIMQAEKQIAEELGQLPPRQNIIAASVTHTVIGYTTSELDSMLS